jgi:prepilin signal peptidase PulO-like enzyme (type II secretory pathway)
LRVGILLFLLLFGILPGILYALYVDSWVKRCPSCDQKAIIPADSPLAQR